MMLYRLCKPLCLSAALAFISMTAFPAQTTTIFEPITDESALTDGTSFYIVSVNEVPYAVNAGDPVTKQRLISSFTNSGLGVRSLGEICIQELTISGSSLSDCYLMQGDNRYLGYDSYSVTAKTYVLTELDDDSPYRFSISIGSDGSVTITPYLAPKKRLGMYCGDEESYNLYEFRFLDVSDAGYVPIMLVSDITEQLSDAPTITSTDGMLVTEPVIPEGYTLEYRVREVPAQVRVRAEAAAADDAGWKPWNRSSYISDLFAVTTDQYDLDMRYSSDGLYSAVTTMRFDTPVLTGISDATAPSEGGGPSYYDTTGRPIPRRALIPGHPYIRVESNRRDLIIAR